jgi:2-dehydro-3-deoxygluconokinase
MVKRLVSVGECMIEMSATEAGTYRLGFAGDTLNSAWGLRALLGEDWQVDYVTALGDDLYSFQMRTFFEAHGIGTGSIQTIEGRRPGLYMIHQKEGDRHFTYWRDQAAARLMAEDRERLFAAFDGADFVYFSGISLAILHPRARGRLLKAIVRARDKGARVAFDPNVRPALWRSANIMKAVLTAGATIADIVLPTHGDEAGLFGDANPEATARRYLDQGVGEVAVKDGAKPAVIAADGAMVQVAAKAGARIVDPTGAGDAFNAAYLTARLNGTNVRESAEAAHRVASLVIGERGALVEPEKLRDAYSRL